MYSMGSATHSSISSLAPTSLGKYSPAPVMRLLLWVLLATLVTLLGSADSASSTIATTETAHNIKFVDSIVADTHNTNVKRSLRSSNQLADDEERALPPSVANLLAQAKVAFSKSKTKLFKFLSNQLQKWNTWRNSKKPPTQGFPQPARPSGLETGGFPQPVRPPGVRL
ncbi:Putative RxLR effector [Phytophthora palmivora]|uniref:RxLR effector protein n=1 Tax=Phytophthora palmivora TaxID=4796 RepID=A0A2P4XJV2_9STRA|nr:Putative RxLR effector [Phytophthora palmivora]